MDPSAGIRWDNERFHQDIAGKELKLMKHSKFKILSAPDVIEKVKMLKTSLTSEGK